MESNAEKLGSDGFINFYKPSGMSSMEAVRTIKRMNGVPSKIGHAGTLDPLATGLLPICVGKGTRLMSNVLDGRKEYLVDICLGSVTDTYDAEGTPKVIGSAAEITICEIEKCLKTFIGVTEQIPPMYSAVKVNGKRLYKLAREGKDIERAARTITIYDIQVLGYNSSLLTLSVQCGKGVYIRSLAHDLGSRLGCGGYVANLERVRCGSFYKSQSVTLEEIQTFCDQTEGGWRGCLIPIDFVIREFLSVSVSESERSHILHGRPIDIGQLINGEYKGESLRAYDVEGRFLALLQYDPVTGQCQPKKVFDSPIVSGYAPS